MTQVLLDEVIAAWPFTSDEYLSMLKLLVVLSFVKQPSSWYNFKSNAITVGMRFKGMMERRQQALPPSGAATQLAELRPEWDMRVLYKVDTDMMNQLVTRSLGGTLARVKEVMMHVLASVVRVVFVLLLCCPS